MAKFESQESAFNFAVEYLKQISESLKMCSFASANEDPHEWSKWLRNCYRQLSVKLEDEEIAEIIGKNDVNLSHKDIVENPQKKENINFRSIYHLMQPQYYKTHKSIIMFLLDSLEVRIRRKLQQKGMLLPSKSDPKFAILER